MASLYPGNSEITSKRDNKGDLPSGNFRIQEEPRRAFGSRTRTVTDGRNAWAGSVRGVVKDSPSPGFLFS